MRATVVGRHVRLSLGGHDLGGLADRLAVADQLEGSTDLGCLVGIDLDHAALASPVAVRQLPTLRTRGWMMRRLDLANSSRARRVRSASSLAYEPVRGSRSEAAVSATSNPLAPWRRS
jgi:hypothetical protein